MHMTELKDKSVSFAEVMVLSLLIIIFWIPARAQSSRSSKTDRVREINVRYLQFGDFGEVSIPKMLGKRNLSKYRQGGHYDFRTYLTRTKRGKNDRNELINFVFDNWTNRRLAYARYSFNTPDAGGTFHLFIEPDKEQNWTVLCRLARWQALLPGTKNLVIFPRAYSVERVSFPSGKYDIAFKDKAGRLLGDFGIDEH